jgi:hypothetical protein
MPQEPTPAIGAPTHLPLEALARLRNRMAFMLAESMIAAGILALIIVLSSEALLTANRLAAASRILTGARAIVQRNIDNALTTTFTQALTPAILATTTATGSPWSDDGEANGVVQIAVQDQGTTLIASGVLTRTVVALSNSDNAVVLQVTFSLTYKYRGRTDTIAMTTIRSRDD